MSKMLNYYQDAQPVYGPDDTDYDYQLITDKTKEDGNQ